MKKIERSIALIVVFMSLQMGSYAQIIQWEDCGKFLGNISAGDTPENWLSYWNQVSPENGGKWGSVEGTRDVMNWTDLDKAYHLAKDNGLLFKQHVFVWGNQQPSWIESLSAEDQLAEIEEWVMSLCERYPDTDIIEVVNEPINDAPFGATNGNYANALGGIGITGKDWIIKAFEIAKKYCPNAQLMINEYNLLNNTSNLNKYIAIVQLLKDRELIDAVGAQAHAFTVNTMKAAEIKASLDKLGALGLPIYITELDIDTEGTSGTATELDNLQLARYKEIFPALWNHPSVKGVTLWGYVKNKMWRTTAYLVSSSSSTAVERPAMKWLKSYITEDNACKEVIPEVTGVNEHLRISGKFNIYPNPILNQIISIKSNYNIESISILDMGGRTLQKLDIDNSTKIFELPINVNSGIYLLEIKSGQIKEVQRVIVR